jgi:hypothetical protein
MRKSANQGRAEETGEKRVGTWKEEKSRKEEKERRNETGCQQKESIRRNKGLKKEKEFGPKTK